MTQYNLPLFFLFLKLHRAAAALNAVETLPIFQLTNYNGVQPTSLNSALLCSVILDEQTALCKIDASNTFDISLLSSKKRLYIFLARRTKHVKLS